MATKFPRRFDLSAFKGAVRAEFSARSDAFQQLVGDGLVSMSGHQAHVYPTAGRDGKIDCFIEELATVAPPFTDLSLPIIVECKDHDDSRPAVAANILREWGDVQAGLNTAAQEGFQGLFQPWKTAKTYVYAVSAVFPSHELRENLRQKITSFFRELSAKGLLEISNVRVLDWNDIRLWLDGYRDICDSWLGTGAETILSLEQYSSGLVGFKRFLKDDSLPFLYPPNNAPFHPDSIRRHLDEGDGAPGILLSGAGGVGKTRTIFEVARKLGEEGWRVLFVLPDANATIEQLVEVVSSQRMEKTLLVFEYLDQMAQLDFSLLRRVLVPRIREANGRISFLASSRSGFLRSAPSEWHGLLKFVELKLESQDAVDLSRWVVQKTANSACSLISPQEMMRLCGRRPIIALLIAQQLERSAREDVHLTTSTADIRLEGTLTHWLQSRLSRDELFTAPVSVWTSTVTQPHLVAAAGVLACAPDDKASLAKIADEILNALKRPANGMRIVSTLADMGWLEIEEEWANAVHDVVADEVLEKNILDAGYPRREEVFAILSAIKIRARSLGRLASALTRVCANLAEENVKALLVDCEDWFVANADVVSARLQTDPVTQVSNALGTVLGGSVLEDLATRNWSLLISPWLELHDTNFATRHLLRRGLRGVESDAYPKLCEIGMRWLARHRMREQAASVFGAVLYQNGKKSILDDELTRWGFEWLRSYGRRETARYVLWHLLHRESLGPDDLERAIKHGLEWLRSDDRGEDARIILAPLLRVCPTLDPNAPLIVNLAIRWGERFRNHLSASFILEELVLRSDLGEFRQTVVSWVDQWLQDHGTLPEAERIIESLVKQRVPEISYIRAAHLALNWLEQNASGGNAHFIVAALLKMPALPASQASRATRVSLEWLEANESTFNASFVWRVIATGDGLRILDRTQIEEKTLRWLKQHHLEHDAQYVMKPLLTGGFVHVRQLRTLSTLGLGWLELHGALHSACHILGPLLGWKDYPHEHRSKILKIAQVWIDSHGATAEAGFVFEPLFQHQKLPSGVSSHLTRKAVEWAEMQRAISIRDIDYVLAAILRQVAVPKESAEKTYSLAHEWLRIYGTQEGARFLIDAALSRHDLPNNHIHLFTAFALKWLDRWITVRNSSHVLAPILRQNVTEPLQILEITKCGEKWIRAFGAEQDAGFVNVPWIHATYLTREQKLSVFPILSIWARRWTSTGQGGPALAIELFLVDREDQENLLNKALAWLRRNRGHKCANQVFSSLLQLEITSPAIIEEIALTVLSDRRPHALFEGTPILKACYARLSARSRARTEIEKILKAGSYRM